MAKNPVYKFSVTLAKNSKSETTLVELEIPTHEDFTDAYPDIIAIADGQLYPDDMQPFTVEGVEFVSDLPEERYAVSGRYSDGDPWDNYVMARSEQHADFEARWEIASNSGGDPSDPAGFKESMQACYIDDSRLEPVTLDEALGAVRELIAFADALDKRLDDPTGDGKGTDARPPTGDDYNELHSAVMAMKAKLAAALT